MAITQNTLIGRANGRVGNAVFSTWKGRNILKQKPEIVANPRTGQQQANRARFTGLLALGRLLRPLIVLGFKEYSGIVSWLNRFMSTNSFNELMTWNTGTSLWETDFTKLVVSEGSLFQTPIGITQATATLVEVEWNTAVTANQMADDLFYAVAITNLGTAFSLGTASRSDGSVTITVAGTVGQDVTVAGFFMRNDGTIVSNNYTAQAEIEA